MKGVVVLGGLGGFGATAAGHLRAMGMPVRVASRRSPADVQLDADDPASIRRTLAEGDLVLDAAGPFHRRSMALIEAAVEIGFDIIDLNDNLRYAENVLAMKRRINRAGVRVLNSASSVSAVAAALVRRTEVEAPVRIRGFIVPASRRTAHTGSALSLLDCIGRPVRVLRDGRMRATAAWRDRRRFPMPNPLGTVTGRLVETADAVHLPRLWPTLTEVETYVDTKAPGLDTLLRLAAASPTVRRFMERRVRLGTWIARKAGRSAGGLGYEVYDAQGRTERWALLAGSGAFAAAVAPAVLAARAIAEGGFTGRGLIPPDRHVEPLRLFAFLDSLGICTLRLE